MLRKEINRRDSKTLSAVLILGAVLAACAPETQPDVNQTITDSGGIIESTTPQFTSTVEATPTQEATATPEIIPMPEFENMHEYSIHRAKQVGIDLENLDNSNNLLLVDIPHRKYLQDSFENNFQGIRDLHLIIVGVGGTNSLAKYEQMPITSGGHKIILWAEAVFIKRDGKAQTVLLPMFIENEDGLLWEKGYGMGTNAYWLGKINSKHLKKWVLDMSSTGEKDGGLEGIIALRTNPNILAPGTMISLKTIYPSAQIYPQYARNEGLIEEPIFDRDAWTQFTNTGDPSGLSYWTKVDGFDLPFVFPFVAWSGEADVEESKNQKLIEDFKMWVEDYSPVSNKLPLPQYWTPIP
jgi:hypothetical protein